MIYQALQICQRINQLSQNKLPLSKKKPNQANNRKGLNLKKLTQSYEKNLPRLRVYLEDLIEICNILKNVDGIEHVRINTCGHEINGLEDDLEKVVKDFPKTTRYLTITAGKYEGSRLFEVSFYRFMNAIECHEDSAANRGAVSQIEDVLLRRTLFTVTGKEAWAASLLFGLVFVSIPFSSKNENTAFWGFLLFLLTFSSSIILLGFQNLNHNSEIVFAKKKDRPNFFTRKKDELIMLLIGTAIGVVLTIVTYFIKNLFK